MVTDAREISVKYFRALSFLKLYQDKRELGASWDLWLGNIILQRALGVGLKLLQMSHWEITVTWSRVVAVDIVS